MPATGDVMPAGTRHKTLVFLGFMLLALGLVACGDSPEPEPDVAPVTELEASITVCKQAEHKRLDRQKLVDLGIDQEIIAAASITVPSKLHFRIGGINAGITQNGVTNGVTELTPEEE